MYVAIDLTNAVVKPELVEPEDTKAFKVVVRGPADEPRAREALAAVGELVDRDEARVRIDAVLALAPRSADPRWRADFDAMLDYARTKGWIDPSGTMILAHCEWVDG